MPDWTAAMEQDYEYYVVDPGTWKDVQKLTSIKSSSIQRDSSAETLGSASIDMVDMLGECYIRIYLVTIQNGLKERHALGTFLIQTPSSSFDGKKRNISVDAYTPLIELKEKLPPLGYSVLEGENIMDVAGRLVAENVRAPVVKVTNTNVLYYDFVADTSETWMSFTSDLIANAKYKFALDDMGRILFEPDQDIASLQPVWTYTDDNSSILQAQLEMDHDLYDVPNVVEVMYSNGTDSYYTRVVNDDPSSPTSTVNRGREKVHRVTDPDLIGVDANSDMGGPTKPQIDEYAIQLLKTLSTVEYTITYTHGYCPVRLGDCVRLNYARAGLTNTKAKVIYQSIACRPGCQVQEKAVFTTKLWG